jgi:hypothetical protein
MDPQADRIDEHLDGWAEWEASLDDDPIVPAFEDARRVIDGLWKAAIHWQVRALHAEKLMAEYKDKWEKAYGSGQYADRWEVWKDA